MARSVITLIAVLGLVMAASGPGPAVWTSSGAATLTASPVASPVNSAVNSAWMCVVWFQWDGGQGLLGLNTSPSGWVRLGWFLPVSEQGVIPNSPHSPELSPGDNSGPVYVGFDGDIANGVVDLRLNLGEQYAGLHFTGTADRDVSECTASLDQDFPMRGTVERVSPGGTYTLGTWEADLGAAPPRAMLDEALAVVIAGLRDLKRCNQTRCPAGDSAAR